MLLVQAISTRYAHQALNPPAATKAHSTRAQASSWAAFQGVDPVHICKAATWSNFAHLLISLWVAYHVGQSGYIPSGA